jgi:hypothetical protein
MSHDMLHHAELKIFFEMLHKFEFIWIWNLVWIWIWKPYRKRNRKGIRKSREKEKGKAAQLAQVSPARPRARAAWQADPACQWQFFLSRTPSLSRSLPTGADLSVPVFFTRALPLSLSRGPGSPVSSCCPRVSPFLSLRRGPAFSVPPSPLSLWTGACALAHVAGFLGHDAHPRTQLPS